MFDPKNLNLAALVKVGLIVILGLWAFTFSSFVWMDAPAWLPIGNRGTFGDMFGGLNTLFSGMAFLGIVVTILMQQKELSLQRDELIATRGTLKAQREEMASQNRTLEDQKFENTFFSLIGVLNDIINSIDLVQKHPLSDKPDTITKGRDCMRVFQRRLISKLKGTESQKESVVLALAIHNGEDLMPRLYMEWWQINRDDLGHYFRMLFNIVKFVDQSDMKDKAKYVNFLRAQMSDQEQALLFYNCLSEIGEGFKKYVVDYKLVKHVPDEMLVEKQHKSKYYPEIFDAG